MMTYAGKAKERILDYFKRGKEEAYPDEAADELGLDLELVVEITSELVD